MRRTGLKHVFGGLTVGETVRSDDIYRVRYADGSKWDTLSEYMRPSGYGAASVEYTFLVYSASSATEA